MGFSDFWTDYWSEKKGQREDAIMGTSKADPSPTDTLSVGKFNAQPDFASQSQPLPVGTSPPKLDPTAEIRAHLEQDIQEFQRMAEDDAKFLQKLKEMSL
jgi:hypothetical protein